MAIRKPSDYFNNENNSIEETIKDNAKNSELNTFSDAYNAFKRNLSKVDVLNDFSETLSNYQFNIEKVNHLSTKIDEIDEDIKNLLTKEDLDKALISQLLFLEECIRDVQEKVKGINHKNLTQVKLDISSLSETVNVFIDEEIPRYEKLVVESETRLIDKCDVLEDELKDTLDNIKDVIDEKYISDFKSLNEEINKIKTNDIPKYKNLIVDSEIKTDSKIKEFAEVFDNTVNDIVSKIELVKEDNTEIFDTLNSKVNEVNQIHNLMLDDIEKSENTRDELDKKIVDLEVEILRNESHIESQNKNIEDIHGDVKSAIDRLNIGKIEENNFKLGEKIKYLEEVFEKFNEKELLNENIIVEPSSTDNDDPLTPLDKNFVTLDQLQNHYRLFINRIQQQLASFGGGGEVRLEFLDDIDRDSAKVNGKFLKYDSASGKWVGANASGGSGSQTLDETLGLGNTSSLGMSVGVATATKIHVDPVGSGFTYSEDLVVQGNARVTGILSIGTSSIVLDANNNELRGVQKIRLNSADPNVSPVIIKQVTEKIVFVKTEEVNGEEVETEEEVSVGIGTTVSINTSGIITASSFAGSLIGTATNATNLNNQAASYYLNYNNFSNTPTALSSFSNDVGFVTSSVVVGYATEGFVSNLVAVSTFSGNYNDLSNTPTALSSFSNDVGFVTSSVVVGYATEGFVSNLVSISTFSGNYNDLSNTPTALSSFSNDVGFITAGASGAGLTALTGASSGIYGNSTNSAQITVDSNGRITSISQVAISGGGGGISGIKILNGETSLGVTTNLSFGNNLNAVSIGNTVSVSLTGVVTSLVGYATEGFVSNLVSISTFSGNYNDLSNTPTVLSSFSNDVGFVTSSVVVGYATEGFVNSAVAGIVSSAPTTLDTLNELAQALGDDANFSTTVTNLIGTKASLSGATFAGIITGTLDGTASNATNLNNQAASYYLNYNNFSNTPTALSSFSNDVGFVTSSVVVGYATEGFVSNLVSISTFSGNYNDLSNTPTAYGDSDVDSHLNRTQQVSQNYVLSWNGQDYAWVAQSSGGISNVVEDTSPQLGGNLDLNNKDITGTGNLNVSGVVTATSFSGAIELSSDTSPQLGGNLFTNGNDIFVDDNDLLRLGSGFDFVMTHDGTNTTLKNHTGDLLIGTHGGEASGDDVIIESADDFEVRLNTGTNSGSGTTAIYATGGGSVALNHNGSTKFETTSTGVNVTGNIAVSGTVDGRDIATDGTKLDGIDSFATAYGDSDVDSHLNRTQQVSQNYVLSWNGQDYAWVAQSSGGISNVVEDTTPQLGGNLDLNSKDITGTGNVNLTGVITATSLVRSGGTSSQFLKADGSVDSSTYLTSYTETDPVVAAINGIVKSNGTTISAATAGTDYLTDISQDTTPQLGGNLQTNSNDIIFADNDIAEFGNNSDFRILHNGTNTFLSNYFGDLIIGNYGVEYSGDDIIIESADDFEVRLNTGISPGSGTTAIYATGGGSVALNHNGSTKFETTSTGVNVTGNITVSGTVDGRDLATDGTKLDNIASNATAYGDSDVDTHLNRTQQVSQNYVLSWNGQDYVWVAQSSGGISNVVEDTTPQLGGNLDLNNKDITGTGNLNVSGIVTATSFSGAIELSSDTSPQLGGALETNGNSIRFADNNYAIFGAGYDLEIFHNGTNSVLRNFTGDLLIGTRGGEASGDDVIIESADDFEVRLNTGTNSGSGTTAIYATGGGSVALNHNGSTKFETTSTGVNVTGNITVSGTVDGRDLATDGTKLDNIASNATAYGDSDVDSHLNRTQQVSQNYVLSWNGQDYAWVAQSGGGISNVVEDTTPQLGGLLDTNSNNIQFADNDEAIFGANSDVRIKHDGNDNHITSNDTDLNIELNPDLETPKIYIRPNTSHQGITLGGGSGNPVELYHNNSKKFETTASGIDVTGHTETDTLNVSGVSTFQSNVHLLDSVELRLGTGNDLKIYHDSNNSYISDQGTGNLKVLSSTFVLRNAADNAFMLQAVASGAVKLFHNNTNRLETTSAGVTITGSATATSFVKSGGTSSQYLMADGSVTTSGGGGGGASEAFKTIAVSGQSDVVADSATDTLTLVAGSNMTITTNATNDEITFDATGGGGVTTGKAIAMAMIFG